MVSSQAFSSFEIVQTSPNDDFLRTIYTTKEGLPQNTPTSIIQTQDGYLWLSTFGGLVRYDGVKFTSFTSSNTPEFINNRITAIYEDKNQNLWIGSEDGDIVCYHKGVFQLIKKSTTESNDSTIQDFYVDQNDNLWIGTAKEILTYNIKTKEFISYLPEFFLKNSPLAKFKENVLPFNVKSFAKDNEGTLWIATNYGLLSFNDKKFTNHTTVESIPDLNISWVAANPSGGVWLATRKTVGNFQNNVFTPIVTVENDLGISKLVTNQENESFFINDKILYKVSGNEVKSKQPLQSDIRGIRCVFIDREENLWIGTNLGLNQLKKRVIKTFSLIDENVERGTNSILETPNNGVWITGPFSLLNWKNGIFNPVITHKDNLSFKSLAFNKNNEMFFGSELGIFQLKDDKPLPIRGLENIESTNIFFDRENNLWFTERNRGVSVWQNGQRKKFTNHEGLVNNNVSLIFQDRSGSMWFGTKFGLSRLENGEFTNYTTQEGLVNEHIREIFEDEEGTIWIGTYGGGISRLKDGKIVSITSKNGLAENIASRILTDDFDRFWVLGNQGIYTVSRKLLNDFADGKIPRVYCTIFNEKDGMKTAEGNGGNMPAGWKASDGKLWFPMIQGGIIVEPTKPNLVPPPTFIENVSLNKEAVSSTQKLEIQPNQENLDITYTAVSFVKPEQIQFRYKLEGYDTDWQEVGTRRTAYYPYLPPGTYKFIVSANNGSSDVWSEKEASLEIVVYAPFWRTWWFLSLIFVSIILLIVFIYQRRLEKFKRRRLQQEEFSRQLINAHETERNRIARDLHDGLGQDLLIIKNWSVLVLQEKNKENKKKYIEEITSTAAHGLSQMQTIARNLRPQNLERLGLTQTLILMIEQIESSSNIKFETEIELIDKLFTEEETLSIYRIVQENLNNIVKHSEATQVELNIVKKEENIHFTNSLDKILIQINDNGKGFALQTKRKTSFGLDNIDQRVQLLGGTYSIKSEIGKGTQITIYLPIKERISRN